MTRKKIYYTKVRAYPHKNSLHPARFGGPVDWARWRLANKGQVKLKDFIGACGDNNMVMKLQVQGNGTPTSKHTAIIYQPDFEGIYTPFDVNEPVWRNGQSNSIMANFKYENDYIELDDQTFPQDVDFHIECKFTYKSPGEVRYICGHSTSSSGYTGWYVNTIADGTIAMRCLGGGTSYNILLATVNNDLTSGVNHLVIDAIAVGSNHYDITISCADKTVTESNILIDPTVAIAPAIGSWTPTIGRFDGQIANFSYRGINIPINERSGTVIHDDQGNVVGELFTTNEFGFWSGRIRNESNEVYSVDYDNNLLDPKPLMHYQPAATNELKYSTLNDIATWTGLTDLAVTDAGVSEVYPNIHKWRHENTNSTIGSRYRSIQLNRTFLVGDRVTFTLVIANENALKTQIRLRVGSTAAIVIAANMTWDTNSFDIVAGTGEAEAVEIRPGIWKLIISSVLDVDVAENDLIPTIYPTGASISGGQVTVLHHAEVHVNKTIEEFELIGPIFTDGAEVATDRVGFEYDMTNLSNESGAIYMEVEPSPGLIVGTFLNYGMGELIPDPNISGTCGSEWACFGDWTILNGRAYHPAGTANGFRPDPRVPAEAGASYLISFQTEDVASANPEYVALRVGNTVSQKAYGNETVNDVLIASNTDAVTFTLSADWDGYLTTVNTVGPNGSADFTLIDSAFNIVSVTGIADQVNKVGARWHAEDELMSLMVNGTWSADVPYNGTITDDFKLFTQGLNTSGIRCIRTWLRGTYEEYKDMIDAEVA